MQGTFKLENVGQGFRGGNVQAVNTYTGERVSLALAPSDVHDASEIPELLQSYKTPYFRAAEASPVILVDNLSDKYRTFNDDNAFQPIDVKTSGQAAVAEVDPESALSTYTCQHRAIGSFIPLQTEMTADFDVKARAAKRCVDAINRDIEIDVMLQLGTNTNWDASVRTAAATAWDVAGSTPIVDLRTAIEASWQEPRAIFISQQTAHALIDHDDTKDLMRQWLGDANTAATMRDLGASINQPFDFTIPSLPPFKVVSSQYVNAAGTKVYCHQKTAELISGPLNPSPDQVMSAATFRWKGPNGTGFEVREYIVEGRGPYGGTMIVVSEASDHLIIADKAGGIITNTAT